MVSSAQTPGTAAPESRRERAFDLHERGELEAAARDYREVLELAPDDLEVMHALGLLELQRARYDAAAVWLGKALQGRQTAAPAARAQLHAQLGSALFGAGRATAALEALDRAIALDPSGKSVHLQRAAVLESLGRYPEALASYEAVTALAPADPLAYLKRAGLLLIRGLPVEALSAVNRAIELGAVTAESYTVRGLAERALGSTVQAQASYRQALRIEPRFVPALVNQGILARAAGRSAEALDLYDRALEIQPDSLEALLNRAAVLLDLERPEQALESAERAARRYPDRADVGLHRAEALARLARLDEALAVYDAMLATNAAQPMALAGRAFVLQHLGRHAEALESSARAMELAPGLAAAHFNHGAALRDLGRIEEAVTRMEVACALEPHNPTHQCNLGGLLLLQGHFERGLELYEWRSELPETPKVHRYPTPRWQGREDLRGRTLFTYLDQGLGDTIQFARYARLAEQGGARVIVSAQSSLLRLLRSMSPTLELLAEAEAPERYDLHCPLASLPRAFGTTLASIPASVPYLFAEPERIATWRQRLGVHGLKVGVCWQGAPTKRASAAPFRSPRCRRSRRSRACASSVCNAGPASSSSKGCRRACSSRPWERISTPDRMPSSMPPRSCSRSIS